jgi:CRP-like cAMP-binding protein
VVAIRPTYDQIFNHFGSVLQSFAPVSEELFGSVKKRSELLFIEKDIILLPEGKRCENLYFIFKGLVRAFYVEKEQEITSWFARENDFIYSPSSFLTQKASSESVQMLEDSILIAISHESLDEIYDYHADANKLGRLITEFYLIEYDKRLRALRTLTAKERLCKFSQQYPEFYGRIPNKYIASFLGMSPETYSRILKKKN